MPQLLTIRELSDNLKISTSTIYHWVANNKIPFVKMPGGDLRFDEKKIQSWIEQRTIKAKAIGTV